MPVIRKTARSARCAFRALAGPAVALVGCALTLALGAVALLPSVDARAMIVTSGSMAPAIGVGALVIVEQVDPVTITTGDVITFNGYARSGLTTHRVIDRTVVNGRVHFRTQGDANDTPDVDLAPAEGVVGRVRVAVPHAGRALGELSRAQLRDAALGVVSLWLLVKNGIALRDALHARPAATSERGAAAQTASAVVALVLVAATASLGTHASSAVLLDTSRITDNTFTTGTW